MAIEDFDQVTIAPAKLRPFSKFIMSIGELPTSYLDSLSYAEQVTWFCNFLQDKVIPAINNNAEALEEVQRLMTQLQEYVDNYFTNLDVQEEINNKLDDMVEQGVLQEIIADYLNSKAIFGFDNVASMKSSTNLIDGSYAETLGYYTKNDGGAALYKIREITNNDVVNGGNIIALDNNTLIAELVSTNITPEMFGAYGDGIHNDTNAFNTLINNFNYMYLNEKTYKITSLTFTKDFIVYGNNATLIDDSSVENFIQMTNATTNKVLRLYNLNINANNSNIGIYINKNKLEGNNIKVINANNCDINIVKTESWGACDLTDVYCQLSPIGIKIDATDCKINGYHGFNCIKHIINNGGLTHINNCHGWNFNSENVDWITGSTLIECNANLVGNDIYIDTLENGIVLPNGHPYTSILLQNVSYFLNTSSYPATQQAPALLKNHENYTGYCRIDGFFGDDNGWHDSNNKYPTLIDGINLEKISLTNVTNSGFRFNRYKPIETNEDIQDASYNANVDTYVTMNTRKVKYKDYDIHIYLKGNMRTGCASGNIIYQASYTGQQLSNLSIKTRVRAIFVESSNDGVVYDLPAYIDNNARLTIYNNTGVVLGGSGHYGEVHVYIDDIHQN